jgi:Skp family chaperone for outer membrane proteins
MSRYLVSIIAAAFAAAFLCVSVSSAEDAKYGFVDMQKFMAESTKAKAQQKKLMDLLQVKKTSLEKMARDIQTLKDEVQKQAAMLDEKVRNDKIKEVTMKETEFKLAEQEAKSVLQNEERDMMESLQQDMMRIITKIRQDKKLALVFNSAALLSADDALNITAEVAKAYDADTSAGAKPAPKANKAPVTAPAQPKKGPGAK